MDDTEPLKWSARFSVRAFSPKASRLYGDKIILPPSALEALLAVAPVVSLPTGNSRNFTSSFDPFNPYTYNAEQDARAQLADRQQQLPHPLTFRVVNPYNGRIAYAGIREFSAEDDEVVLSPFLREVLGVEQRDGSLNKLSEAESRNEDQEQANLTVTIHAKHVPKGTYVRLRPLEAGYDAEDWKSLLERYLRDNFTTLTKDEILSIPGGHREHFRFLVDKFEPEGDSICVVDTDLEVDIEALNEEQARETLKRKLEKAQRVPGISTGISAGGVIELDQETQGQVLLNDYVDYEIKEWPRDQDIQIDLTSSQNEAELDLFVSPFSSRHRAKPRNDEHMFCNFDSQPSKRVYLSRTNVELENVEFLCISVHAWNSEGQGRQNSTVPSQPIAYTISATSNVQEPVQNADHCGPDEDETICKNCQHLIPQRTLPLHEAFCYRNNTLCPHCHQVFQKRSDAWQSHWHCPHDESHGITALSHEKHNLIFHPTTPYTCSSCNDTSISFSSLPSLAQHRTHECPSKSILCQFCHLLVPQQGPDDPSLNDPEVLLSGFTPHEVSDGARTTECHICGRITRLRDMKTHLRHHDFDRQSRPAPQICVNPNCGRSIPEREKNLTDQEHLGLCGTCFGPLYVTTYDPEGKALKRRVERRLLQQLTGGCGQAWCQNLEFCRTAKKNATGIDSATSTKEALPLLKPVMENLNKGTSTDIPFCVDNGSQQRRTTAEALATTGDQGDGYLLQWWIKALEQKHGDFGEASVWLESYAPKVGETR